MKKIIRILKKLFADEEGFSMIELMVVIAIIAIIGAVTVPKFINMINKAKVIATNESLNNIKLVLMQQNPLPSTEDGLESIKDSFDKNQLPKDGWGHDFIYNSPGREDRRYEVISLGADNREGGEGFDADIEIWE